MHDYSTALYDVGIQVEVVCATRDIGIQCDFTERITSTPVRELFVPPNFIETCASDDNLSDSSYHDSQCSSVNESLESSQHTNDINGKCYLVFESALMLLFSICKFCCSSANHVTKTTVGSLLIVSTYCENCLKKCEWKSQPFIRNIPAGNILTSAAILFSGSLPSKALRFFNVLNCPTITKRTFFDHQRLYLQPAINVVWELKQDILLDQLRHKRDELAFGGDGRADSPGHSAKYGSYTLMELSSSKVVDFQLVQV